MSSVKNRDSYVYIGDKGASRRAKPPNTDADGGDDDDSYAEREDEVDPQGKNQKRSRYNRANGHRTVNGRVIGVLIMALLILALLGVLVYYIIALFDTIEIRTNCGLYNKNGVGTIPKKCPDGREYYGGMCYKKCLDGYRRAAACTCEFGSIHTDCKTLGKTSLPTTCTDPGREYYASTCVKKCPDGYRRSAGCSCEKGEYITNCEKYGNHTYPVICPSDREYYAGTCVKKCPSGYTRTASCSCEKGELITNCQTYGALGIPTICPNGRELYGSTCVKICPVGYTRTAACTCVKGSIQTNCDSFGFKTVLQCPPGKIYVAGLCYDGCRDGGERVAACTCNYNGSVVSTARPPNGCPSTYPYEIAGLCYAKSGVLTDCGWFGSSIGVPNSCPNGDHEVFASACYGKCPSDASRTSFCTCSNLDIKTDCGLYGDPKGLGDAQGPQCNNTISQYYGGLCYGKCPVSMSRTAACTCSNKEVITSCADYGDGKPVGDPQGPQCNNTVSEYYGGLCYKEKCPADMERKAGCTCSNYEVTTNCLEYGDPKGLLDELGPKCTSDQDYFGGFCYEGKCPLDQQRTAACTCDNFETVTDCYLYGDGRGLLDGHEPYQGPRCEDDEDFHAGLCYKDKCPEGFRRSAICTCQKLKTLKGFLGLG